MPDKQSSRKCSQKDIDFLLKSDLNLAIGLTLSEANYNKYVKGNESHLNQLTQKGYILVLHTGEFEFYHYGTSGLTHIKPSNIEEKPNLSFGSGIYCFNAKTHIPFKNMSHKTLYKGRYKGKYLECVCDCDPQPNYDKGYGNTQEYLLLTDKPISVTPIHLK